jgi:glutamyl-tRNA synthetase
MTTVRTRFAPSPTGSLHIGGLRSALYPYALAKHSGGDFILRIEDTDKKREVKGSKEKISEILKMFGINWDEYYVQSERLDIYKNAAEKLVKEGHAYIDAGAIRLKVRRDEKISYHDFVLDKNIEWDSNILDDMVLLKSDGFPTYHLAAMVDDIEMKITHVLRGHDWMPSTPIHLLVYKYLGGKIPEIGHLTDIMDPEGGKLSKRKGSTSVEGLLTEGYLPEAILNFIILLGWAPKDNKELFTLEEFVKAFDTDGLQKSNPVFNREKLDWFNGEYIRKLSDKDLVKRIFEFYENKYDIKLLTKIIPIIKDRIKKLSDFEGFAGFFFQTPKVDVKLFGKDYKEHLKVAAEVLEKMDKWTAGELENFSRDAIAAKKFSVGNFFMSLRIAITGSKFTPPINDSILILGKEETLYRISHAQKEAKKTEY